MLLPTILAAVSIVAPLFVRAADTNLCKSLSIPEGGWVCTGERTFSQCSYGVPSSFAGQPCAEGTVCCQSSSQCDYASNCKATYKDSLGSASASASSDNGSSKQGQYVAPESAVNPPISMPNVPPAVYSPLTMPPAMTPTTPAPTPVSSYSVAPTPVPTPTPTGPEAQPYGGWGSTGGYAPPPQAKPVNYNAPVQTPAPNAWLYNPVPIEGYGIPGETPAPVQYYNNYAPQPEGYGAPPRDYHSWRHHRHTPPCTTPRPVYMTHHRHHWKAPWTTKSRHHHYPTKTTTVPKPEPTKAGYKHGKGQKHHHKKPFEGYPVNDPLAWGIDFTVPKNADGGDLAAPYGRYMQPQKGEDRGVYGEYGPDDLQPVAGKVGYAIPPKQESRYGAYGSDGEWPASYGDDAYRTPVPQPQGYGEPAKPVGYGNPAPVPVGYGKPADKPKGYGEPVGYGSPASAPVGYGKPADMPKGYGEQDGYSKPAPAPVGYGSPAPVPVGYGNPAPVPVGYGKPADKPMGYGEPVGYGKPAAVPVGYGNPAPAPVGYGKPVDKPKGYGEQNGYSKPAPVPVGYGNPAPVPVGYGKPADKPMGYGEPVGYGHPIPAPAGYGSDSMPKGYGDAMPEPQQYGYTHAKPDSSYGEPEPQGYKQKKPKAGDYAKYLASLPPAIRYKRPASSYGQHTGVKGYGGKAAEPASYGAAPAMPGYDQKAPQAPAGYYGRGSK